MNSIANSAVRHLPEGTAIDAEFASAQQAYADKWKLFLPLKDYPPLHPEDPRVAAYHFDWLKHPDDDAYWQAWSIRPRWSNITVPALNFEGWYDLFVSGGIETSSACASTPLCKPCATASVSSLALGSSWLATESRRHRLRSGSRQPDAGFDEAVVTTGSGHPEWRGPGPRVRVFVMGANKWRTSNEWPIEGTSIVST
jgi:predicted acyl esterase